MSTVKIRLCSLFEVLKAFNGCQLTVKQVSNKLGVNINPAYRRVHQLIELGLVEVAEAVKVGYNWVGRYRLTELGMNLFKVLRKVYEENES